MTDIDTGKTETIRQHPGIKSLLQKLPKDQRDSFTDEQLLALKVALGARRWGKHAFDIRGTIGIWRWRYYYVILGGRERRILTRKEEQMALIARVAFLFGLILFSCIFLLLVMYLAKSAMGINLFPDFSLGIWQWFKANVMLNMPICRSLL